jgi:hypothetical protein
MPTLDAALGQIDAALDQVKALLTRVQGRSEPTVSEVATAITLCASTIERLTPPGSSYRTYAAHAMTDRAMSNFGHARALEGVLQGFRIDLEAGYLTSVLEEAHAEVFADLLEIADHLLTEKLLEPAAVMAGGALEAHLRALAEKTGVTTSRGGKPKRAGLLNDDLAKKQIYSKTEHKQVMAWQGIRNSAAHAEGDLARAQVALMAQGIRDFISRHPA